MQLASVLNTGITAFFILIFTTAHAQFDTTAVSATLIQAKEKLGKDVAFILVKDGKVVYKKELGNFTIKTQRPIGASSQWLTAALVMTFVQEGKLSLDDKVSTFLPIFSKHFKSYITIRHCLTHHTGVQSEQGVGKLLQKNKFRTLEEEVNEYASKRDIQTNAGEEFRYTNIGFSIAGRVLEIISKRSFDRLMQDRIFRQAGMRTSTFSNQDYNDAVNPAVGARSTAADFANFLTMLLNKGSFNNKQVLTEQSVELLHTLTTEASQMKYVPKTVEGLNYGHGEWILESNTQGKTSAAAVPSLTGSWSMIDLCRKYACVIITKELSGEQPRNFYLDIKATIDDKLPGSCK